VILVILESAVGVSWIVLGERKIRRLGKCFGLSASVVSLKVVDESKLEKEEDKGSKVGGR
jgi:hypothetical protein